MKIITLNEIPGYPLKMQKGLMIKVDRKSDFIPVINELDKKGWFPYFGTWNCMEKFWDQGQHIFCIGEYSFKNSIYVEQKQTCRIVFEKYLTFRNHERVFTYTETITENEIPIVSSQKYDLFIFVNSNTDIIRVVNSAFSKGWRGINYLGKSKSAQEMIDSMLESFYSSGLNTILLSHGTIMLYSIDSYIEDEPKLSLDNYKVYKFVN